MAASGASKISEDDLNRVIDVVAEIYGVTRADIKGMKRLRTISLARAAAVYIVYRLTVMNPTELGRLFGGFNRKSVMAQIESARVLVGFQDIRLIKAIAKVQVELKLELKHSYTEPI